MACNPTVQYDDFTGDGQQTSYTITFPYDTSSKTDVMVRLGTYPNYTYPTYTTDYSVDASNPNQVNFVTAPSGPIRIFRCTPNNVLPATFQAGSAIRSSDLNNNFEQLLFVTQDASIRTVDTQAVADDGFTQSTTALSQSTTALSQSSLALSTANAASNAVSNVVPYNIVANVSSLPSSAPDDGARYEVADSTNAESTSSITGLPSNFVGASGLNLRLQYSTSSSSYVFVDYIVQDPDSRYAISNQNTSTTDSVTFAGITGPLTGDVTGDVTGSSGSCTGNAATATNATTATTLQTARNIGGVSFNGSADINLPGVNTAGNQDTSGNAATATNATTATTLQTARTINGTSFDGSANIVIGNIPQNSQASAYTLIPSDAGKHINTTSGNITVQYNQDFKVGDAISIYNNNTATINILEGSGATIYLVGSTSTGQRSLVGRGLVTVLCIAINTSASTVEFIITGVGLT